MTFKTGVSGNPSGRPKGSGDKRTKLRELLEPHAEALTAKAVELALAGDINALRLCLERLIPKARYETVSLNVANIDMGDSNLLMEAGKATIQAVMQGTLSPEQGKIIASILELQASLFEVAKIHEQLQELEASIK